MLKNNYKTALVTGASSGIGEETVKLLIRNNIKVYAIARRKNKLIKLEKVTAGLGRGFTKIFNTKAKDIDTTIDTNVNAFLQLLRCITPHMVKNKKGHIINIGSIAGLYPLSSSVYGGSKGAVHLINQNLRIELSGTGVRCTEINPGRVATEFFKVAIDNPEDR